MLTWAQEDVSPRRLSWDGFLVMLTNSGPRALLGTETNLPRTLRGGVVGVSQRPECGWGTNRGSFHFSERTGFLSGLLLSLGWRVAAVTRGRSRLQATRLSF